MKTRGIRRVSDTVETVEYTPAKSAKIAKWLMKQGASKVPAIFDDVEGLQLTDDFGYPCTPGMLVGFGDIRIDSRAPGDVAVGKVLWFPADAFAEEKVVYASSTRQVYGGGVEKTNVRLMAGFEEVV